MNMLIDLEKYKNYQIIDFLKLFEDKDIDITVYRKDKSQWQWEDDPTVFEMSFQGDYDEFLKHAENNYMDNKQVKDFDNIAIIKNRIWLDYIVDKYDVIEEEYRASDVELQQYMEDIRFLNALNY